MATVDEVLEQMGETEDIEYLVIDNDLRTITVPNKISILGVESDDSVNRLYFKMPATYCGIDLSEFSVRINYRNAQGEDDFYLVTDISKVDDQITFSWLVGRHAFAKSGEVLFIVCMRKYDTDNTTVIKEYNTLITKLSVGKGLETDEAVVIEYTDVVNQLITQWGSEVDTAVNNQVEKVTEAVNSANMIIAEVENNKIPAWQQTIDSMVDGARLMRTENRSRNVYTAIAEGERVHVEDAYTTEPREVVIRNEYVQNGTPTPDNPIEIETLSAVDLCVSGADTSSYITNSLILTDAEGNPVEVCPPLPDGIQDKLVLTDNGDGTAAVSVYKVSKSTTTAATDGVTATVGVNALSSTGEIANGATVIYKLATPQTINCGTIPISALPESVINMWVSADAPTSIKLTYELAVEADIKPENIIEAVIGGMSNG